MLDLRAGAIAANRFGFGVKPGELSAIAADPRGWLKQQLGAAAAAPPGTPSSVQLAAFLQARKERKTDADAAKMLQQEMREIFRTAITQRSLDAANSATPFRERLVQFWSNHFTVSIQRPIVIPVAVGFENEAIRPNVTGNFRGMLSAVATHPAMLLYLDNAQSVGPNSTGGRLRDKGLNENLAREMLELHTVGVDGGYSQTDVTEFAKILTGWSIARDAEPNPGSFRYRPVIHENHPFDVNLEQRVEMRVTDLAKGSCTGDSGVGEDDIGALACCGDYGAEFSQIRRSGDVPIHRRGCRTERGDSCFQFGGAAREDEHCRAFLDESTCGGKSYPAAAASDDRCLTCQEGHGFSPTGEAVRIGGEPAAEATEAAATRMEPGS